jgi:hypothetical protein
MGMNDEGECKTMPECKTVPEGVTLPNTSENGALIGLTELFSSQGAAVFDVTVRILV